MAGTEGRPVTVLLGATGSIGRATAVKLGADGRRISALVRSAEGAIAVERLARDVGIDVRAHVVDTGDDRSVRTAIDAIEELDGRVETLLSMVGGFNPGFVEDLEVRDFLAAIERNFLVPLRCIKAVVGKMRERGRGTILVTTSVAAEVVLPSWGAYCASKAALDAAVEALALEVRPFGVQVGMVIPGITVDPSKPPRTPTSVPAGYEVVDARYKAILVKDRAEALAPEEVAEFVAATLEADPLPLRSAIGADLERHLGVRRRAGALWPASFAQETDEEFADLWLDEGAG